ncbi:MAG: hypothetical protein AAF456_14195 [Planctomycetota bacterium]
METTPFTIRDAFSGIQNRKVLVLLLFVSILSAVGIRTLLATKYYSSEAKIFVRLGRENVGLDPTATLGEGTIITTPMSREAEITSVVHMIRSRDLYEEAVDNFGPETILRGTLEENTTAASWISTITGNIKSMLTDAGVLNDISNRERAIIELTKNFKVEILDYSNVISVSYETESPDLAKEVVQWVVARYEERHARIHRPEGAMEFMQRQADEFLALLQQKEAELETFKIETGMVSSEMLKGEIVSRIAAIRSQLRDAEVEVNALDVEVERLRSGLETLPPTTIVQETRGAGNDGADGMRQLLYEQEMQLADLSAKHTQNHPSVIRARDAVETSRSILQRVEEGRTEFVRGSNPVHAEIQIELLKKEPLLQAAKGKLLTLQQSLEDEMSSLETFSRNERKFKQLTRDLELEDLNYRQYMRNLAQVTVDQSLEQSRLSNISVSQAASYSEKPVRPNKLVNLIIGLTLATFGSFGTAILLAWMKQDPDDAGASAPDPEDPGEPVATPSFAGS